MLRERPILFTGSMVTAILAGQKTQTRRPVKNLRVRLRHEVSSDVPAPAFLRPLKCSAGVSPAEMNPHGAVSVVTPNGRLGVKPQEFDFLCPYADGHTYLRRHPDGRMQWNLQPAEGSRLWVRETLRLVGSIWTYAADGEPVTVDGGDDEAVLAMRSWAHHKEADVCTSIHMPRWACRLVLEVTAVRVERVRTITEGDASAEGMLDVSSAQDGGSLRTTFLRRWDALYAGADFACARNPWVWVVEFRRVEAERSAA